MVGQSCAVFGCKNNGRYTKKHKPGVSYHNFPKSKFVPKHILKEWVARCKRGDNFNITHSHICSDHFTEDDFERDLRNELLGLPIRKLLKKTAVPSLNLPNSVTISPAAAARTDRQLKKVEKEKEEERRKLVNDLLRQASEPAPSELADVAKPAFFVLDSNQTLVAAPIESITEPVVFVSDCINKMEVVNVKSENSDTLAETNSRLRREIISLKRKIRLLQKRENAVKLKFVAKERKFLNQISILEKFLTKNQIDLLTRKKSRVTWTIDEIVTALTIRFYSHKTYLYLKNKLNYPLPGVSTLNCWAAKVNIKPGLLEDVFKYLEVAGNSFMQAQDRIVVLSFDEVNLNAVYEYDVNKDEETDSFKTMQVCMVRSLCSPLKQPIFIDFDQKITSEIINDIITELHNISYNCIAIVSNCSESNVALWNSLEVDMDQPYFKHPVTGKKVYVFVDALHLLLLIRNCLLDTSFIFDEEQVELTKVPLEHLIFLTDMESDLSLKISDKHLRVLGSHRRNVRLAVELLSNNTAEALKQYLPGPDTKNAEDLAVFIETVNCWFDVFNSSSKQVSNRNPLKAPFGLYLAEQEEHLEEIKDLILSIRVAEKQTLQPFQEGLVMSIISLKLLYQDIRQEFPDISYVCTNKFNFDELENLFAQLGCRGTCALPSALEAMKRMQMIILGVNLVDTKVNYEDQELEEYIVPKVLYAN